MKITPILHILSILVMPLAGFMLISGLVDLFYSNINWINFLSSAAITLFIGMSVFLATRTNRDQNIDLRQAFILTTLSWLTIAIFGAIPFYLSNINLDFTNSFFESMSGITTTGSTVIVDIESSPPGILVWRSLLQWLGGIGVIVMAIAIFPMLSVGGMQLFKTENFEAPEKVIPRATSLARGIFIIYSVLTLIWATLLYFSGMYAFDAILHSMTTIATGGYSTKTNSIGAFNSDIIDWVIIIGMVMGSLPFIHYLALTRGSFNELIKDSQVKLFLGLLSAIIIIIFCLLLFNNTYEWKDAIRYSAFNVTSILTGTGYGTADFGIWGGFAPTILLLCMFIGGCAGSTTCGIRMFRIQVLASSANAQLNRLLRPHSIVLPHYNQKPVPDNVTNAVMGFFFIYILTFAVTASILSILGLDFETSISGAATAISNVGPGLGEEIGPSSNFNSIPMLAKWTLCSAMILGRLELFTILVLFTPGFWKY